MSQQKQAPLPRQEFQEWLENAAVPVLVLQKGKHLGSVVKVPATPCRFVKHIGRQTQKEKAKQGVS